MKLLKFPFKGDPILNRIESLQKHVLEDDSGEYLDEILFLVENYCRRFPMGEYPELDKVEQKIAEARFWLNEYMSDPLEAKAEELKDKN